MYFRCCAALLGSALLSGFSLLALADTGPAGAFKTLPGFSVDLVHDVTASDQGSWVSLCLDPKGRIIASDQYGKLYRVTLNGDADASVEQLEVNIGMAQGMLYAFDSLYININAKTKSLADTEATGPGVYRLTDTTGDDQFDKVEYIVPMTDKAGEHGPHALVLSPDGTKIYFCSGNQVDVPESAETGAVPRHWDEDHLLGRMPDARGHMQGRLAPGGWICRMDPDGSNVELMATGFRNEYDIAFNPQGDLFAYDADMEWDIGTPWYRPTRVNHVISGAEFGWRNGTGKWPEYYGDSFGAVVRIGPGSPTGIAFGTGTNFPAKYQNALFISDWSYGVIHAVHMNADGASYSGTSESFVTAAPMAVTDLVVHPDGSMYFAVGGRRTASGLYRLSYTGDASTEAKPAVENASITKARELRRTLEKYHLSPSEDAIDLAIANLGNSDRAIRFAARIALEHLPVEKWRKAALAVDTPQATINAAYALARCSSTQDQSVLLDKLTSLDFASLPKAIKLELIRAQELVWMRLGEPNEAQKLSILGQLDGHFPSQDGMLNRELAKVLIHLQAPNIVSRTVEQMSLGNAQDDQIHYAFCLRNVANGWDAKSRRGYFQWFFDVGTARGGASFGGFLSNIRNAALDQLSDDEKEQLGELAGNMPAPRDPLADLTPRKLVEEWSVEKVQAELAKLSTKPDFETGRMLTATASCFKCHRFNGQGGIQGPDLTAAGKRFNDKDMLTAIIEPNKEISDQYQATQFLTEDGVVVGKVANLSGGGLSIVTNMLSPGDFTKIKVADIVERRPSPVSMMPSGLLDTFTPEQIGQMLAYLKSGGVADHEVYKQ